MHSLPCFLRLWPLKSVMLVYNLPRCGAASATGG